MGLNDGSFCCICLYRLYKSIHNWQMIKSRTMWFSLALVVFGALFDNFSYVQNIIDPQYYGISIVVIGIIVAILRFLTSQPLEDK